MRKIFVVGPAKLYAKWINNYELTDNLEEADIVMFTGGEDVDPSLYDCKRHPSTYSNIARDLEEKAVFEKVKSNQLCLGVCRGSQLLCCLNGGRLVQNVSGHASFGTHQIYSNDFSSSQYEITSTHHQMQYPFVINSEYYKVLYYSKRLSRYYEGDGIDYPHYEPEIVLYTVPDKPKCLAIQGHPEMMRDEAPVIEMLNKLIDSLC